ncbi:MAG TPA: hypothetical protein LFW20_02375 [Rickettsia endosymbiont of Omalisus fontisbellaquei]|nr:hypothetical protein [Rickettsia endosymbiont of Omalisus fontisbellaquei]
MTIYYPTSQINNIYEDLCDLYNLILRTTDEENKKEYFEDCIKNLKKEQNTSQEIAEYQNEINKIILKIKNNEKEMNDKYSYLYPFTPSAENIFVMFDKIWAIEEEREIKRYGDNYTDEEYENHNTKLEDLNNKIKIQIESLIKEYS